MSGSIIEYSNEVAVSAGSLRRFKLYNEMPDKSNDWMRWNYWKHIRIFNSRRHHIESTITSYLYHNKKRPKTSIVSWFLGFFCFLFRISPERIPYNTTRVQSDLWRKCAAWPTSRWNIACAWRLDGLSVNDTSIGK